MAIPHFRIPFRIQGSAAAVVEQDTHDEIAQCVQTLVSTVQGERIEVPDYGIPDQVFLTESQVQVASLSTVISRWEPRALATLSSRITEDELVRVLGVRVKVRGG